MKCILIFCNRFYERRKILNSSQRRRIKTPKQESNKKIQTNLEIKILRTQVLLFYKNTNEVEGTAAVIRFYVLYVSQCELPTSLGIPSKPVPNKTFNHKK